MKDFGFFSEWENSINNVKISNEIAERDRVLHEDLLGVYDRIDSSLSETRRLRAKINKLATSMAENPAGIE